jgi:hypothetical protein
VQGQVAGIVESVEWCGLAGDYCFLFYPLNLLLSMAVRCYVRKLYCKAINQAKPWKRPFSVGFANWEMVMGDDISTLQFRESQISESALLVG